VNRRHEARFDYTRAKRCFDDRFARINNPQPSFARIAPDETLKSAF
jgi:hypothetical protein